MADLPMRQLTLVDGVLTLVDEARPDPPKADKPAPAPPLRAGKRKSR